MGTINEAARDCYFCYFSNEVAIRDERMGDWIA